jgi:hypothetical protein
MVAAPANIAYETRLFRDSAWVEFVFGMHYLCATLLVADWALIIDSL